MNVCNQLGKCNHKDIRATQKFIPDKTESIDNKNKIIKQRPKKTI